MSSFSQFVDDKEWSDRRDSFYRVLLGQIFGAGVTILRASPEDDERGIDYWVEDPSEAAVRYVQVKEDRSSRSRYWIDPKPSRVDDLEVLTEFVSHALDENKKRVPLRVPGWSVKTAYANRRARKIVEAQGKRYDGGDLLWVFHRKDATFADYVRIDAAAYAAAMPMLPFVGDKEHLPANNKHNILTAKDMRRRNGAFQSMQDDERCITTNSSKSSGSVFESTRIRALRAALRSAYLAKGWDVPSIVRSGEWITVGRFDDAVRAAHAE